MYILFVILAASAYAVAETLLHHFSNSIFASKGNFWKPIVTSTPDGDISVKRRFDAYNLCLVITLMLLITAAVAANVKWWQVHMNSLFQILFATAIFIAIYNVVINRWLLKK